MTPPRAIALSPRLRTSIASLLTEGRRLDAVKLVRQEHHLSLKDCLRVVEDYADQRGYRVDFQPTVDNGRSFPALLFGSVLFLAASLCFGGVAFGIHQANDKLSEVGLVVIGNVIGLHSDGKATAPIVGYTVDDATFEYRSNVFSSMADYQVGDSIRLWVDPKQPHSPLIDDASDR